MRVFGIVGDCQSKRRLVPQVIGQLASADVVTSVIKRVSDDVDLDRPGKGSYEQRQAGACEILIANSFRWALMRENALPNEPDIDELLARLGPTDLVLLEGFHLSPYPKIELIRSKQDRRPSFRDDSSIIGVVCDTDLATELPCFRMEDVPAICAFVQAHSVPPYEKIDVVAPAVAMA
ncbi:MAG: molybdopterin-guanine dinucleotide biosynthesis protein B [Proteobacteria bacterium]|nr:molybdopterin-guanine dinucleotide biosynthesis protein B [Pseudomonadota bacterium]